MPAPAGPCKDCLNRFVGCHADCEKYKEFRAEMDRANELIKKNKMDNNQFSESVYGYTQKYRRRSGYKRKK